MPSRFDMDLQRAKDTLASMWDARNPTPEGRPQTTELSIVGRVAGILEQVWLAHHHANHSDDVLMVARLEMIATNLDKVICDMVMEMDP